MKIIVAPDSFKESLSAELACQAIKIGIKKAIPNAKIILVPMADGGEGTINALLAAKNGKRIHCKAQDPLGKPIRASYGLIDQGKTAVIEMAECSGLALVPPSRRNPLITTSYGTGELIRHALDFGSKKILLTLGGVATNDAGAGMAQALGYKFLDKNGKEIPRGAKGLKYLFKIDSGKVHSKIFQTQFIAACDVKNPLCGPKGSAKIYGPQKGATPSMVKEIDSSLHHFAKIIKRDLKIDVLGLEGAGAAGGAGAGVKAFFNANLKPGVELVMEACELEKKIKGSNLVVTGEGKIDRQTLFGKTLFGIAKISRKHKVPVIAFCARIEGGLKALHRHGIHAVFPISRGPAVNEDSFKNAQNLLAEAAEETMRLIKAFL